MRNHPDLKNKLKVLRTEKGLTQSELALAVNVSRKTINTIENCVFIPSTVLSLRLANALSVTVEDLFQLNDVDLIRFP